MPYIFNPLLRSGLQFVAGDAPPSSFSPDSLPGLNIWLDSRELIYQNADATNPATSSGQQVKAWRDKHSSKLFSNSSGANIPTLLLDAVAPGIPSVRFDGSFLLSESLGSLEKNDFTLFVITKNKNSSTYPIISHLNIANNFSSADFFLQNGYQCLTTGSLGGNAYCRNGYPRNIFAAISIARGTGGTRFSINKRVSDGSNTSLYSSPPASGLSIGTINGLNSSIDVAALLYYNRKLSLEEHTEVANWITDEFGLATPVKIYNIILDGNSITEGASSAASPYWDVACNSLGISRFDILNYGASGNTTAALSSRATTLAPTLYDTSLAANKNIVICWEGTNSLGFNTSIAQTKSDIQAHCQAWRNAGFKVIVATIIDRNSLFSGGQNTAGFQAAAADVNAWLRINYATFADALADPASNPLLGNPGAASNNNFQDGTHPSQAGHALIGGYFATATGSIS